MKKILEAMKNSAFIAGIPEENFFTKSAKNNVLLPKPRLEYEVFPALYTKTGRFLHLKSEQENRTLKKELYKKEWEIQCTVYADAPKWLEDFFSIYAENMPSHLNDTADNHVGLTIRNSLFIQEPEKRIGKESIHVLCTYALQFTLALQGRVTTMYKEKNITHVLIPYPKSLY